MGEINIVCFYNINEPFPPIYISFKHTSFKIFVFPSTSFPSPRPVVILSLKSLGCLQSHYYIHFSTNTLWKVIGLHYLRDYMLNCITAILLQWWLWYLITQERWYAIKQRKQTNTLILGNYPLLRETKTSQSWETKVGMSDFLYFFFRSGIIESKVISVKIKYLNLV